MGAGAELGVLELFSGSSGDAGAGAGQGINQTCRNTIPEQNELVLVVTAM